MHFFGNPAHPTAERGSDWFKKWLSRDPTYTPEPYQCAKVLREMGTTEMADDILYAGPERDRTEAWHTGRKLRAASYRASGRGARPVRDCRTDGLTK
jgi:hypothetical protein